MKKTIACIFLCLWAFPLLPAPASGLTFDALFNDGAVLQAEMPVNVWGQAEAGKVVTVRFAEAETTAQANENGRWLLQLPAMPHSSDLRTLTASTDGETVTVNDVVVGEVWLASGQSNMVWALNQSEGGEELAAQTLPLVRFVKVPLRAGPPFGGAFTAAELAWTAFVPNQSRGFSAVASHFAAMLQNRLDVPVGIVQSAQGATPAEAWTPLSVFQTHDELMHYAETMQKGLASEKTSNEWMEEIQTSDAARRAFDAWRASREGPRPPQPAGISPENPHHIRFPSGLYENMIVPLIPYTFRGVIWYQGEGNSGNPTEYRTLFPAMIASWREAWNQPDWPFLFVQLAAFDTPSSDWPGLRAAQAFTRDTVPHTGMALAIDCGEADDIHPRKKKPVGERLAALALNQVYAQEVPTRGPLATRVEAGPQSFLVFFDHAGGGLQVEGTEVHGVEVVDKAGHILPVSARVAGPDHIEVLADPRDDAIVELRYGWRNWLEPPVNLSNGSGLPAEPFLLSVPRADSAPVAPR